MSVPMEYGKIEIATKDGQTVEIVFTDREKFEETKRNVSLNGYDIIEAEWGGAIWHDVDSALVAVRTFCGPPPANPRSFPGTPPACVRRA